MAALALVPAARASVEADVETSGALTATWHGDPARGCAEAGVCDVSGVVSLRPPIGENSGSTSSDDVLHLLDIQDDQVTIRVLRGPLGDPAGACLDAEGTVELVPRAVSRAGATTRVKLAGEPFVFGGGLSAGRCAGPLAADLEAALPAARVPTRALRSGALTLDYTGVRTFAAGPFSGVVRSTLVMRARVSRKPSRPLRGVRDREVAIPVAAPRRPRAVRRAELSLSYEAAPARGSLRTEYDGGPAPACETLDACGLYGIHELTFTTRRLELRLSALVPARRGRAPTLAQALAAVHAGRARASLDSSPEALPAQASVMVARDGLLACRDTRSTTLPPLVGEADGGLELTLGARQYGESEDPLRTRCPGPARDADRDGPLAAGRLARSQIGAAHATVRLDARPAADAGFHIQAHGSLTLKLVRTGASVRALR